MQGFLIGYEKFPSWKRYNIKSDIGPAVVPLVIMRTADHRFLIYEGSDPNRQHEIVLSDSFGFHILPHGREHTTLRRSDCIFSIPSLEWKKAYEEVTSVSMPEKTKHGALGFTARFI